MPAAGVAAMVAGVPDGMPSGSGAAVAQAASTGSSRSIGSLGIRVLHGMRGTCTQGRALHPAPNLRSAPTLAQSNACGIVDGDRTVASGVTGAVVMIVDDLFR